MNKPLISVLMPVYNARKFVSEAIESVLNQTFRDFEFLIIDDGSTDNSVSIIRAFSDPRIRFFQNDSNLGITYTLNRGIELAQADLIARMDADDFCYPDRLQKQYNYIIANPDGALYSCWAKEVTEERKEITIEKFNPDYLFYNTTFSMWMYHPTMVYRKEAVKSVGKYVLSFSEDYELVWSISRKFKIYLQPEVLLEYRLTNQSLWQVTEKTNYRETYLKQVRRNIQYYLGETDFQLENWHIDYLIYAENFKKQTNIGQKIIEGTKLLDIITEKMLMSENINRNLEAIKAAAQNKRDYTLLIFTAQLNFCTRFLLLIKTKSYRLLKTYILSKLKELKRRIIQSEFTQV